jgi:tetratricopeptide (TPR) repeat protein
MFMNSLRLLFFLLTLGFAAALPAQSLIFYQNSRTDAFLVKLHGGGPSQQVTDHFIDRLSGGSGKAAMLTEFVVAQDENIRLTKAGPMEYDVQVTLGNLRLTGDTQYRGFGMGEQLRPTGVQFTLERVTKAGVVMERFPFGEVALSGDPVMVANFRDVDSSGQFTDHLLRVADKQILYAVEAKGNFDRRTILIDDYYAAVPQLDALEKQFKLVNPDDFEHIDLQQKDLNLYLTRLQAITVVNYPQLLNLDAGDPGHFLPKYQTVNALAHDLNARVAQTKNEIPERYLARGRAYLQQNKPGEANKDFMEAVRLKPALAEAHLELARLRYREGDVAAAKERLIILFRDGQPDDATRVAGLDLGNTLYQNQLSNADYAIQQKKYAAALKALGEAHGLCTDLQLTCTPRLDELTRTAHVGIYQEILTAANKFADEGKLTEAEAEARKAVQYQVDHTNAIVDPRAANTALLRVKGLQYKEYVSTARGLNQAKNYRKALPLVENALAIEKEFAVVKDAGLWALAQSVAKPIILEDYAQGQVMAQSNQLGDARKLVQGAGAMTNQYLLQGDLQVLEAKAGVEKAIFSQECTNAQAAFDGTVEGAIAKRRERAYIAAASLYEKALQDLGPFGDCGIDSRRAVEGRVEIATAVQYQQLLVDGETAVDRNESQKAIDLYTKAGELFLRENLGVRFGLVHVGLFEYILGSGRIEFTRYGAQYFTERKEYDHAVDLLHKAVQMKVAKGLVKELMVRLGTELAVRDRPAGGDPKVKVLEYTRGNSGFKGLEKAYLKARK